MKHLCTFYILDHAQPVDTDGIKPSNQTDHKISLTPYCDYIMELSIKQRAAMQMQYPLVLTKTVLMQYPLVGMLPWLRQSPLQAVQDHSLKVSKPA